MGKRIDYWKNKGYTNEQIENHLIFERRRAKEQRERRKKNIEPNKELVKQIKKELIEKTFKSENERLEVVILKIRESDDGLGFWFKYNKKFSDGSQGEFRDFNYFTEYNKKEFLKYLFL